MGNYFLSLWSKISGFLSFGPESWRSKRFGILKEWKFHFLWIFSWSWILNWINFRPFWLFKFELICGTYMKLSYELDVHTPRSYNSGAQVPEKDILYLPLITRVWFRVDRTSMQFRFREIKSRKKEHELSKIWNDLSNQRCTYNFEFEYF